MIRIAVLIPPLLLLISCHKALLNNQLSETHTQTQVSLETAFPKLRTIAAEATARVTGNVQNYKDDYIPVNLLLFCSDVITALWWDSGSCEFRTGSSLTANDCRLSELIVVAAEFVEAERILIANGYPEKRVLGWVQEIQTRFLTQYADDYDYSPEDVFGQIAELANSYARADTKVGLPAVTAEAPRCGGGLLRTYFVGEGLLRLHIIPLGYYKICEQVFRVDPSDFHACDNWRVIPTGTTHEVSGIYQYVAEWVDGRVTQDRIDFDYSGFMAGEEFPTEITR